MGPLVPRLSRYSRSSPATTPRTRWRLCWSPRLRRRASLSPTRSSNRSPTALLPSYRTTRSPALTCAGPGKTLPVSTWKFYSGQLAESGAILATQAVCAGITRIELAVDRRRLRKTSMMMPMATTPKRLSRELPRFCEECGPGVSPMRSSAPAAEPRSNRASPPTTELTALRRTPELGSPLGSVERSRSSVRNQASRLGTKRGRENRLNLGTPEGTRTPDRWIRNAEPPSAAPEASSKRPSAVDEETRGEPGLGQLGAIDAVEVALADAIQKAAAAGAFDVLPKLVAELEARRKARAGTVDLAAERAKRGRS
jgi:hypothetical protein